MRTTAGGSRPKRDPRRSRSLHPRSPSLRCCARTVSARGPTGIWPPPRAFLRARRPSTSVRSRGPGWPCAWRPTCTSTRSRSMRWSPGSWPYATATGRPTSPMCATSSLQRGATPRRSSSTWTRSESPADTGIPTCCGAAASPEPFSVGGYRPQPAETAGAGGVVGCGSVDPSPANAQPQAVDGALLGRAQPRGADRGERARLGPALDSHHRTVAARARPAPQADDVALARCVVAGGKAQTEAHVHAHPRGAQRADGGLVVGVARRAPDEAVSTGRRGSCRGHGLVADVEGIAVAAEGHGAAGVIGASQPARDRGGAAEGDRVRLCGDREALAAGVRLALGGCGYGQRHGDYRGGRH